MNEDMNIPAKCIQTNLQCIDKSKNSTVPGGVYLCQVSNSVSCGACCGLYNLEKLSRWELAAELEKRTYEFAGIAREVSEIIYFGEKVAARVQKNQPFPEFHHCPYVGLIGNELSRIGCLLHPMAEGNNGIDFRGLSYYGGMACRIYFCPVNRCLPERFKLITRACFDDWYAYGLIITENDLISGIFKEIETRLGFHVYLDKISDEALPKIYRLLTLKLEWPFRSPQWPIVNYFFEDRKYCSPDIVYHAIHVKPSRYHAILQALGSTFSCVDNLHQAESILDEHFDVVIEKVLPPC
jgi:hypothetical protein